MTSQLDERLIRALGETYKKRYPESMIDMFAKIARNEYALLSRCWVKEYNLTSNAGGVVTLPDNVLFVLSIPELKHSTWRDMVPWQGASWFKETGEPCCWIDDFDGARKIRFCPAKVATYKAVCVVDDGNHTVLSDDAEADYTLGLLSVKDSNTKCELYFGDFDKLVNRVCSSRKILNSSKRPEVWF